MDTTGVVAKRSRSCTGNFKLRETWGYGDMAVTGEAPNGVVLNEDLIVPDSWR